MNKYLKLKKLAEKYNKTDFSVFTQNSKVDDRPAYLYILSISGEMVKAYDFGVALALLEIELVKKNKPQLIH